MKKGYEKYKDSGVNWIDEIPNSWAVRKLKHIANITGGSTPESETTKYWDGDIPWVTPVDLSSVTNHLILDTKRKITKEGLDSCGTTLVPKDSIILSTRAPIGSIAVAGVELCTNQGCKAITTKVGNPFFYYYQLLIWKEVLESFGAGATFKELPSSELKDFWITEPSFEEQEVIVNYLDRKTSQIAQLIAQKEKLIELLQEKRQAVINEAVTRGLNQNVKLKDSGIEWLGKIPAHWEVKKLKYLASGVLTGKTPNTDRTDYFEPEEVDWFTPSDFNDQLVLENSRRKISSKAIKENAVLLFRKDSVLLIGIGATLGKIGILKYDASCNQQINAITFNELINPLFGLYYLSRIREQMQSASTASTLAILNQSGTKDLMITCPPISEQNEIVRWIQDKLPQIEEAISKIKVQIEKLHEYRQSLISEVVTGKVDVREDAKSKKNK